MRRWLFVLVFLALSCAPVQRFEDTPIVWYVDDARDIEQPKPSKFSHLQYMTDITSLRRTTRALELRDLESAHDTNALDEVPNSTWFTNRIGVREVTPEEAARGPVVDGPPRPPLVVVGGKAGGRNPGFIAEDATGRRFIMKFDRQGQPGQATAAHVIVNRIFWTIGYFVPQDTIVRVHRHDLGIAPDAEIQPHTGKKRRMTPQDLREILDKAPLETDGSMRASASQLLPGEPIGGVAPEGTRKDDPNDTIAHEHRRVLRALRVFAAWVHHTDIKEDNFLDAYVTVGGRRFVRHHLIDFGETLGGHVAEFARLEDGYEYVVDWEKNGLSLLAFGLWKRPWEDRRSTPWPSVGVFEAEGFDPVRWREAYPFWPFFEMDPADAYWAAKTVLRFDRDVLEAIVAQADLPPEPSAYLVDTLLARAQAIGHAYLDTVTPLDAFHIDGSRLCAYDLGVVYGLARGGAVERMRKRRAIETSTVPADGKVCWPLPADDRYTILRLRTRRADGARPVMQVHLIGGSSPRILGIIRSERGPCMRGRLRPRCR